MKKIAALVLTIAVALFVFTACGESGNNGSGAAGDFDPSQLKTLGDVFARADEDEYQEAYSETDYIFAFVVDGVYYRAVAEMPKDVSDAVWAIEPGENSIQKVRDLVSPLEVAYVENLSEQIPGQEELDKLIGKTGQDLFDDGWTYWYYDLDDMEAGLNHGAFAYTVLFAYDGEQMENTDDFDFYEAFNDLPVASVTFAGLGDATELADATELE